MWTQCACDIKNIAEHVAELFVKSSVAERVAVVFNVGSIACVTTIEYEAGLVKHDMSAAFERSIRRVIGEMYDGK